MISCFYWAISLAFSCSRTRMIYIHDFWATLSCHPWHVNSPPLRSSGSLLWNTAFRLKHGNSLVSSTYIPCEGRDPMWGLAIVVMELWALAKWLEIMDLSVLRLVVMNNLFDVWQLVEFNQTEVQITNWVLVTEKKSLLKLLRNLLLPLPVLPSIWFLDFFPVSLFIHIVNPLIQKSICLSDFWWC